MLELRPRPSPGLPTLRATFPSPTATRTPSTTPWSTRPPWAARTTRVSPSPALMESFPTVWSLLWPPPPLLKLTPRLTHGCTTTVLATLPVPMVMVIMVWDTTMAMLGMDMVIIWAMLGIMVIIWDTTARGPPRLSQLLRLMLRLPQRLTHGCTTTVLVMPLVLMDTVTMATIWVMLLMLITRTLTTEQAAEMATEPWFPVPPGNSVEVSALVLLK